MQITLSDSEVATATYVGKARNRNARSGGIPDGIRDYDNTSVGIDVDGMGAELAVAKYLNVYPDIAVRTGHRPHHDLIFNGKYLEVKQSRYANPCLLLSPNRIYVKKDFYYVLVSGTVPTYTIVGYVESAQVKEVGSWIDFGKGRSWRVLSSQMKPIHILVGGEDAIGNVPELALPTIRSIPNDPPIPDRAYRQRSLWSA